MAVLALAAVACLPAPASADRLEVRANPYVLGQAADWLDGRHVVYHDPVGRDEGGDGQVQIYSATLAGRGRRCLTCGLDGPNQVPVVRPGGRWILFHSWNGRVARIGGAGFGGIGSDLWVMTRDGRRRTNLTRGPELSDNFHAYWSPDGRHVAWTTLNWNAAEGGNGRSEIHVARFDPRGPRLVDEHVVRPGNGHWYETQWWAPDGSGFLYTETTGTAIDPELFFCRLPDPGRGRCRPSRLTRNPAWDEQAVFTPADGPRGLHVLAPAPRRVRRLVARRPHPRPAGGVRLRVDPERVQRQLPPAGPGAGDGSLVPARALERRPRARAAAWDGRSASRARASAAGSCRSSPGTRPAAVSSGPRTAIRPTCASTRAACCGAFAPASSSG